VQDWVCRLPPVARGESQESWRVSGVTEKEDESTLTECALISSLLPR
jgi:hypothetical protein